MEWLEDRTTPSRFFVDDNLANGAGISELNAGNLGFQVTDRDANRVLGNGDLVTVDIPGVGSTNFTYRTDPTAGVATGDVGVAFGTLGLALEAASATPGTDDIHIGAGTYAESLVVNSTVSLIGTTGTATDVKIDPPSGSGVTITADGVTLKNLQVTGSAATGVVATNVIDLTLENVQVNANHGAGLDLQGSGAGSTLTLTNVTVTGNAGGGGPVGQFATVNVTAGGSGGATVTATGTSVQVSPAGTSGQVIDLTGVDALDLTGTPAGDTFVVTPAAPGGAAISVNGGAGAGTDVIDLTTTDGLTVAATPGANGFAGTITPASGPTIDFTDVDQFADGSTISGEVVIDANGNGVADPSETRLSGATVFIDLTGDGTLDAGDVSTTTDANGVFTFSGLPPLAGGASYPILVQALAGTNLGSLPAQTVVVRGLGAPTPGVTVVTDLTAGGTASGVVYNDADLDGQRGAGEHTVAGVRVYLDLNQNGTRDANEPSAVTGPDGVFNLSVLTDDTAANVQVELPLPGSYQLPNPFTPPTVSLTGGATVGANTDIGLRRPPGGTVTGLVYADLNNNGTQEVGENGVRGVTVYLDLNDNGQFDSGEPTGRTDGTGAYTLSAHQNGTFVVRVVLSPGYVQRNGFPMVILDGGAVQGADVRLAANLPPQAVPAQRLAAGFIQGGQAQVQVFGPNGAVLANFPVFIGLTMRDVRVFTADVTGDGVEDVIVATGPGVPTQVVILDGTNFQEVARLTPFESAFTGGVYVTAGDLTGDGIADVIVTPDEGGGPRVLVFRGGDPAAAGSFEQIASFFGIEDPNFRGGARAAVADMNRDGIQDLVVAAGFGGGPRIAVYDGRTVLSGPLTHLFNDFFIFEDTLRNGAFIAAGDVDGDGFADIIGGGGPGGSPRVFALSGADLMTGKAAQSRVLGNFFAGDSEERGGVRLVAKDLDGNGRMDVITGSGRGDNVQRLRAFDGDRLGGDRVFESDFATDDQGGVFVG
jgi:hypothetical protein